MPKSVYAQITYFLNVLFVCFSNFLNIPPFLSCTKTSTSSETSGQKVRTKSIHFRPGFPMEYKKKLQPMECKCCTQCARTIKSN